MASGEEREDGEVIIAGPEDRRQTVLPEGDDRHVVALASGLLGSPEQLEGKDGSPRPQATWSDWVFLHTETCWAHLPREALSLSQSYFQLSSRIRAQWHSQTPIEFESDYHSPAVKGQTDSQC